jgi:hypothetical protein
VAGLGRSATRDGAVSGAAAALRRRALSSSPTWSWGAALASTGRIDRVLGIVVNVHEQAG